MIQSSKVKDVLISLPKSLTPDLAATQSNGKVVFLIVWYKTQARTTQEGIESKLLVRSPSSVVKKRLPLSLNLPQ